MYPSRCRQQTLEWKASREVPSSAGSHTSLNPSPTVSIASNSRATVSSIANVSVKKLKRIEQAKLAVAPVVYQLEVALQSIESKFWSTRLECAEYLGSLLQKRALQISDSSPGDYTVDGRILLAFNKHLSGAHYRVSHCVLKNFLPLLKLLSDGQTVVPHIKTILQKLFQKFIDTKEAVRQMTKEILEHIAATIDSAKLSAIVILMLREQHESQSCHVQLLA
ncbi:hypothetical protein PsorP6_005124 [Peronosclerospora sorghi]|uniref:Uncharacterized protein n=1 Tax=Peronosclerospora sorghi TaxID=230839 RepID=A0ACC0W208_9STRA|nr:hypothetical protein PsorP6_005124 [Peronosclerospora sorghi]